MANEAVIIELLGVKKGRPVRYTCADAGAIPKGTLLKMTDPRTVVASSGDDPFAGIAAHEKVALDGSTTITAYTHGIFDLTNANIASFSAGDHVDVNGANLVTICDAAGMIKRFVGLALEDAAKQGVACVLVGSGL